MKLLLNFLKFVLMGAIITGCLAESLALVVALYPPQPPITMEILAPGFWGLVFGFLAALFGFWIMYFVKINKIGFATQSLIVGGILGMLILIIIYSWWGFASVWWGIPYLGSVYFFRLFSIRCVQPLKNKF